MSHESWARIFAVLRERLPAMTSQEVVATCAAVAKVSAPGKKKLFTDLAARVARDAGLLRPEDLARTASALSLSGVLPLGDGAYVALAGAAAAQKSSFEPAPLVQLLNAFARIRLGGGRGGLLDDFSSEVTGWLPELNPCELSLIANAYARTAVVKTELFEALLGYARSAVNELTSQDMSVLGSAFSQIHFSQVEGVHGFFEDLGARAEAVLPELMERHLSSLAYAFARLRHGRAPSLLRGVAEHILLSRSLEAFSIQELVNLLSALARLRLQLRCHQDLPLAISQHLTARPHIMESMAPVDLLYTVSSLARLRTPSSGVFTGVAQAVLAKASSMSAKDSIYVLHAFTQARQINVDLFLGLKDLLRQALIERGRKRSPSKSDWVVALSAYSSANLHDASADVYALCQSIVTTCCEPVSPSAVQSESASQLTALDITSLLRTLAQTWIEGSGPTVVALGNRLLVDHACFSQAEMLAGIQAVVQLDAAMLGSQAESAASELRQTRDALLSLFARQVELGERFSPLGSWEALSVAAWLLVKREHVEAATWNALVAQFESSLQGLGQHSGAEARREDVYGSEGNIQDTESLKSLAPSVFNSPVEGLQSRHEEGAALRCLLDFVNSCAQVLWQDSGMLSAIYRWLCKTDARIMAHLDSNRFSSIFASLAKLGAASYTEAACLELPLEDFRKAWTRLLQLHGTAPAVAPLAPGPAALTDASLQVLGLSHALAGARPVPLLQASLCMASASQLQTAKEALLAGHGKSDEAGMVASAKGNPSACSRLVTGLQCLVLLGRPPEQQRRGLLASLLVLLSASEEAVMERTCLPRTEAGLAKEVLVALEALLLGPVCPLHLLGVQVEVPVQQFLLDIVLRQR